MLNFLVKVKRSRTRCSRISQGLEPAVYRSLTNEGHAAARNLPVRNPNQSDVAPPNLDGIAIHWTGWMDSMDSLHHVARPGRSALSARNALARVVA